MGDANRPAIPAFRMRNIRVKNCKHNVCNDGIAAPGERWSFRDVNRCQEG
jgi:hypothetical protein